MAPVELTFDHLLSKIKVTITNGFSNPNATVVVKDLKMLVPASATVNVDDYTWTNLAGETVIAFGDVEGGANIEIGTENAKECDYERLTIPAAADKEYTISFTATLYQGEVAAMTSNLTAVLKNVAFEQGKAYNITAELNENNISEDGEDLYPIEFTVIGVTPWADGTVAPAEVVKKVSGTVEANQTLELTSNAIIDGSLNVAGVVDGKDFTLYADAAPTNNGLVCPTGEATVKNVNIIGNNQTTTDGKGTRGIYITTAGNYTFDNVTVEGTAYAINVNTTKAVTLTITNSTLQGWSSWGGSTTAALESVNFTVGSYYEDNKVYSENDNAILRPYGNSTLKNCTFEEGFVIDLGSLTGTISFEGCTYAGAALTAANLTGAEGKNVTIL
jgi:hypothetical protein